MTYTSKKRAYFSIASCEKSSKDIYISNFRVTQYLNRKIIINTNKNPHLHRNLVGLLNSYRV